MQTVEVQIISKVLIGRKKALRQLSKMGIDSKFFLDPLGSMVFTFILKYYQEYGETPTFQTVRKRFPEFKAIRSAEKLSFLTDELKSSWKLVQLENILSNARIGMEQSLRTVDDKLIVDLINLKQALQNGHLKSSQLTDDRWQSYLKRATKEDLITGIPFGFDSYDGVTLGLQAQDLCIILGRQKMGKTNLLIYLTTHWHKLGYKVLFVPMEGKEENLLGRFDCFYGRLNYWKWRAGCFDENEIEKYKEVLGVIREASGQIIIPPRDQSMTPARLMTLIDEHEPDIVALDALYKCRNSSRIKGDPWVQASMLLREMSEVAILKRLPIVATWQVNRGATDRPPRLEHAAFTDSIGQECSIALSIFRNRKMQDDNVVYTEMLANREDENPIVGLDWDWETMTVEEDESINFAQYLRRRKGEREEDE